MAGINTGKVITGGLVAGVAFNITDFIWGILLRSDFEANATRLGLDLDAMASGSVVASWVVVDLLMGLLVVFIYASIRPRFGAGPKTASVAGLMIYLAVSFILFGFTQMGYFTMDLLLKSGVLQLIGVLIGANAGAWMYKEA